MIPTARPAPLRRPAGAGSHDAWWLAASAAASAASITILIACSRVPDVAVVAATVLQVAAVCFALAPRGVRSSRRWLGMAAAICVPLAGTAVAITAAATAGSARARKPRRRRVVRRPQRLLAEARRLRDALPLWDALNCGDDDQRRAALAGLARRDDAEAIAMLRWTTSAADADLAMSAALALDEVNERAEHRLLEANLRELRHAAG